MQCHGMMLSKLELMRCVCVPQLVAVSYDMHAIIRIIPRILTQKQRHVNGLKRRIAMTMM